MASYYGPFLAHYTTRSGKTLEQISEYRDQAGRDAVAGKKSSSATKALANHEWYLANQEKKKKYNREYYRNHVEYWQNYYRVANAEAKARKRFAEQADRDVEESDRNFGKGSNKKLAQTRKLQWEAYSRKLADVNAAKINLDRAMRDYDDYVSQHNVSLKQLWTSGAKAIVNTGKNAVNKLLGLFKRR